MKNNPEAIDNKIKSRLKAYSFEDTDYWSFRRNDERKHMHGCAQYPAMMVPQMQDELIDTIVEAVPSARSIYEPFVGSGTVMIEAMKRGFDFYGQDINPLAVLLCRAKCGPFYEQVLTFKVEELLRRIKLDKKKTIEVNFPGLEKWFEPEVSIELSRIKRAIRKEERKWCRLFFWMAMAEAVRLTCNSRTTTYKLHIRNQEDMRSRCLSTTRIFEGLIFRNLGNFHSQKKLLFENGHIDKGRYKGRVSISLGDSTVSNRRSVDASSFDLLVTSPPYGDNRTTVAYGQYSFLPLQWIDLKDIDKSLNTSFLASAYEIDNISLGGKLKGATEQISELLDISCSFNRTVQELKGLPGDGLQRVAAFWCDLNRCLNTSLSALKENGYMVWTVGNRKVSGRQIPMDKILLDILSAKGAILVERIQRVIPTKRLAIRNNISNTMGKEVVLIMRKGS